MSDKRGKATIALSEREARILALLLHRLTYDDVRNHAESAEECSDMLFVVEGMRQTLERGGRL